MLRIIHNLAETIQVGEQQVGTLISSKTTAEADDQGIGVETLQQLDYT